MAIVGKNGEGKSVAAAWHLSKRDFDLMPWVVIDTKRDELLNAIPGIQEIEHWKIPTQPGVYIIHPLPYQRDELDNFFWNIWENENTGILVDEGYAIGKDGRSPAYDAILMQGRSKHIPTITLSQRPVGISRFVFSEASFHQVFFLNDRRDRKIVQEFIPVDLEKRLPRYWSYYHDVADGSVTTLRPVPDRASILSAFSRRLNPAPENAALQVQQIPDVKRFDARGNEVKFRAIKL